MRHVEQQARIHHQPDVHAVAGDGRQIADGGDAGDALVAQHAARFEGGDDFFRRPQMRFAGLAVDGDRIARARLIGDAFHAADQRQAHGARHDGDMRGRRRFLQHQRAEIVAAIIEQFGRAHGARHQHGIVRQIALRCSPCRWRSSRRARSSKSCRRSRRNGSPARMTRRRISSCTRSTAASAVRPVRTASRMRWRQPWSWANRR